MGGGELSSDMAGIDMVDGSLPPSQLKLPDARFGHPAGSRLSWLSWHSLRTPTGLIGNVNKDDDDNKARREKGGRYSEMEGVHTRCLLEGGVELT